MGNFFRFDGRIRRNGYWLVGVLGLGIANLVLSLLLIASIESESVIGTVMSIVLLFALSIAGLSLAVRRWHDMDKSGWWVLIGAVPIVGPLYSLIMLGFQAGDQGPNAYGPAPREGSLL